MDNKKAVLEHELSELRSRLNKTLTEHQEAKEELESFLSQFTCVLDAPSCGCSEDELNDPKFEALYSEQDRLSKLTKSYSGQIKELQEQIKVLETQLHEI